MDHRSSARQTRSAERPSGRRSGPRLLAGLTAVTLAATTAVATTAVGTTTASAHPPSSSAGKDHGRWDDKVPTARGFGGAISTVDPEASRVGLDVLRRGGNAVDAAVAAAAALGVTEPYSAGIGGGGFFLHYDARSGEVSTIDGRETAPAAMPRDAFIDPATGAPYRFTPELVTSGVSVGTPGTPATWETALDEWGTWSLRKALRPATTLARRGFVVDETFRQQTLDNEARFAAFPATAELFLPRGDAPRVGSRFRNPDLARTYEELAKRGTDAFYSGALAAEMVSAVQDPVTDPATTLPVPPGHLALEDLAGYQALVQAPTVSDYREFDVYGMAPPSSGGSTVGEALNILETFDLAGMSDVDYLHHYLEASALAFADRGAYLGDAAFVDVPLDTLLSDEFAAERACLLDPTTAATKPVPPGDVDADDGTCGETLAPEREDTENISTTNLTVVDKWGNVVEYTLTIEQTGGSGMVVPGRGFLLNNELTDFSPVWDADDPNRIEPGKRPRSSMAPTLVLRDDEPVLALGSPGGSTIITTVLQTLTNHLDRGMPIDQALAAPRATQRNTANVTAEPEFISAYGPALTAYGHTLVASGDQFTSAAEIGAATAVQIGEDGLLTAVSEPRRRGGGAAMVVRPVRD
ncbi:gamma-glutamyltransferase [Isoptericola dokdonensis]|uniref:Glutathione hydrolase proenzyme n=1 Tax=Isoptericola dokdonensis DS-3 TaxID=1300344 RepID=A0A161IJ14_9MICO|nr:gamma-glutamyltransferase [Isoptericola dokdonensis]ANC31964.1 Gamma-glutamyltranspeptidase precursor [Isoptericola dokdonensis DS-3]